MLIRFLAVLLLCLFGLAGPTHAQQPAPATPASIEPDLRVGIRVIPPFVMRDGQGYTGFSIELIEGIARQLNRRITYVEADTVANLLGTVSSGQADLAIAAISITADRETRFDFSQPMFDAGLQIMTPSGESGAPGGAFMGFIGLITAPAFRELFAVLFGLLLVATPIMWFLERRHGETEVARANSTIGQIFNTLWWSASTLTGQGDGRPRTVAGRTFAILFMFTGVIFISYFTATVTSSMTVSRLEQGINGPDDLAGKRVATVRGSTGEAFLRQSRIAHTSVDTVAALLTLAESRDIDAVVFDAPVLQYHAARDGRGKVRIAGPVFRPESYGILFQTGAPLRKSVNTALLALRENGEYRSLQRRYFSVERAENN